MAKNETLFIKPKRVTDLRCECSAEISLPDYNTDVRKILYFTATPHHVSSFASADALECSGEVTFDVVYLDFEGVISSASFSGDYNFKVKCDTEGYRDSLVETRLDNLSLRLMSPRKISAKATLDSNVLILSEAALVLEGDALDASLDPQLEHSFAMVRKTSITPPEEREYAESLCRFEGKTVDDVQLLHLYAKPKIERLSTDGEGCELNGSILVEALIKTDEAPLYKLEKKLDLSQRIDLNEVSTDADLYAHLDVLSSSVAVRGDESGVELALDLICETRIVCEENQRLELVLDSYLCSCDVENTYYDFPFEEYLCKIHDEQEISEKIPFDSLGVGKLRDLVFTTAVLRIKSKSIDGDNLLIEGEILVSSIANEINDESLIETIPLKFSREFAKNVNLTYQNSEKSDIFVDIDLQDLSVNIDANCICLRGKMQIECALAERKNLTILKASTIVPNSDFVHNPSRIEVYYPVAGENLYSIAKSHHTTVKKIAADNPDAAEVFATDEKNTVRKLPLIIT